MSYSARNSKKLAGYLGFRRQQPSSPFLHSSTLFNVHVYEYYHTKVEPWNSLMKVAALTFQKDQNPPPTPAPLYYIYFYTLFQMEPFSF